MSCLFQTASPIDEIFGPDLEDLFAVRSVLPVRTASPVSMQKTAPPLVPDDSDSRRFYDRDGIRSRRAHHRENERVPL